MQVAATGTHNTLLARESSHENEHRVQAVFSQVLEAVGRQGYASAQDAPTDVPLSENIQTVWNDWFASQRHTRYAEAAEPERLRQEFGDLLVRANAEGGYVSPHDFLQGLTTDELQVVQNVHWLAQPIDVNGLTEEGALNLLLPPASQVDINRDGITQTGLANGLRFPDSNTPREVVQAWEAATEGMTLGERMTYEFQMVAPILMSNFVLDENGAYLHHYEPGDPEFTNQMARADYSYVEAAQERLDYLDFVRPQISVDQYEQQTAFWSRLQGLLEQTDVD